MTFPFRIFHVVKNTRNAFKLFRVRRNTFATLSKANVLQKLQDLGSRRKIGIDSAEMIERIDVVNSSSHDLDENTSLRVIQLPRKDFTLFWKLLDASSSEPAQSVDPATDKFHALSDIFQISLARSCALFVKYQFLLRSNMSTIRSKVNLLLDGGFEAEDLMNDLWVLTNTCSLLSERLAIIKSLGLCPMKTWMLRRDEAELRKYSRHRDYVRTVLAPHSDTASYLRQRLDLNDYQWTTFVRRQPSVLRVQVTKLKEIIDFLHSEGFTSEQIFRTPRVLCHSISTLRDRLGSLRELGINFNSLSTLCKNRRQFHEFMMKQEESNKKLI